MSSKVDRVVQKHIELLKLERDEEVEQARLLRVCSKNDRYLSAYCRRMMHSEMTKLLILGLVIWFHTYRTQSLRKLSNDVAFVLRN
jgi:hypothetical protein